MKLKNFNLFKNKEEKVNPLLEDYQKGKILQVNNGVNNIEYLDSLKNEN
jgi:hypothetical protein